MRDVHRLAWELRPSAWTTLDWSSPCAATPPNGRKAAVCRWIFTAMGWMCSGCRSNWRPPFMGDPGGAYQHHPPRQARRVSVLLERRADRVSLIIEDDGRGFDAGAMMQAPATQGKLGLLGMQERVKLAGGSLEIESAPGAGATVLCRFPGIGTNARAKGRPFMRKLRILLADDHQIVGTACGC